MQPIQQGKKNPLPSHPELNVSKQSQRRILSSYGLDTTEPNAIFSDTLLVCFIDQSTTDYSHYQLTMILQVQEVGEKWSAQGLDIRQGHECTQAHAFQEQHYEI